MTAYDEKLAAAIAKAGIPLSADLVAPQSTLRDRMTALVERQRNEAEAEALRLKQAAAVERLRLVLAEQPHQPASPGEAAELRHLLYDADADATVPAFPYPTTQEAS
jgi:hypothetical protein